MDALILSFAVIFVAELGDKSQLMAMTFATRYRFWTVLAGITAATALVHLLSVAVGVLVGASLPTDLINGLAGVAFIGFGLWTVGALLGKHLPEKVIKIGAAILFFGFGALLLAEAISS